MQRYLELSCYKFELIYRHVPENTIKNYRICASSGEESTL